MRQPNFWRIKLYPNGDTDWGRKYTPWILEDKKIIGLGDWQKGKKQIHDFCHKMQVGDIVAVVIYDKPIALVQVCGGYYKEYKSAEPLKWLVHRRPVRVLDWNAVEDMPLLSQKTSKSLVFIKDKKRQSNQLVIEWYEKVKRSYQLRGLDISL